MLKVLLTCFSWVCFFANRRLIAAYKHVQPMEKLRQVNDALFKTAIEAIDSLAPNIEHVILQTGGKVRPHIDKV